MPYLDIWIHLVWATKSRKPLLYFSMEGLLAHIRQEAIVQENSP